MWFLLERFPLPLGAWDGLRYFIVAPPGPSIKVFWWTGRQTPKLELQSSRRISIRKGIINQPVGQLQSYIYVYT